MPKPRDDIAPTRLQDYRPPPWWVDTVDLQFALREDATEVTATLALRRNTAVAAAPLRLDGERLKLKRIELDGVALAESEYRLSATALELAAAPEQCMLTTVVEINPAANAALVGLYLSNGNFCTQCEAQSFRRITFFPDRPDILSVYTVAISADRERYPVLLSNGNPRAHGEAATAADGRARHYAVWHDPHPKPCYLFALVAGRLARLAGGFTTMSGRHVELNIYTEPHNADKCEHAMRSALNAMRWDEQTYGREYDLEVFNIVAVDDFNMGAMENKGLNIFNSAYVLARPDTATDADYQSIEGVIGHEYFHNWSGNRVTCRDWFQLSLKEGFTVFRDQEFCADMSARGVKRIRDVDTLRTRQFSEDAGPMAHPVRPRQYISIDNFYTMTVYHKGAEVIRMLANLLGAADFRKGTDLYFSRHDGQAATTEDFIKALEDAGGRDLSQFRLWYDIAGTPRLDIEQDYDPARRRYTLRVKQHTPDTPGQTDKPAMHIPVRVSLLGADGRAMPLTLQDEPPQTETTRVLHVTRKRQDFVFQQVRGRPVASLLRGLSAPVRLDMRRTDDELRFLMAHDDDAFNRWDAAQTYATQLINTRLDNDSTRMDAGKIAAGFIAACKKTLADERIPPALAAEILTLPSEQYLAGRQKHARPERIHRARKALRAAIAEALAGELVERYHGLAPSGAYSIEPAAMGRRALRNVCLSYLMTAAPPAEATVELCLRQYRQADNMTDVIAALRCLANLEHPARERALGEFYAKWKDTALVVDKWFSLQATSELPDTLARVKSLVEHPAFNLKNPNKVRALIGAFAAGNPSCFHAPDGGGYMFVADKVLQLDRFNPQIASRLAANLSAWRQYDKSRQTLMRRQLQIIMDTRELSKDTFEVVAKSLRG